MITEVKHIVDDITHKGNIAINVSPQIELQHVCLCLCSPCGIVGYSGGYSIQAPDVLGGGAADVLWSPQPAGRVTWCNDGWWRHDKVPLVTVTGQILVLRRWYMTVYKDHPAPLVTGLNVTDRRLMDGGSHGHPPPPPPQPYWMTWWQVTVYI